jgi:hypothetical protein
VTIRRTSGHVPPCTRNERAVPGETAISCPGIGRPARYTNPTNAPPSHGTAGCARATAGGSVATSAAATTLLIAEARRP